MAAMLDADRGREHQVDLAGYASRGITMASSR